LEEKKLYASLMEWATLNILNAPKNGKSNSKEASSSTPTTPIRTTQPSSSNGNVNINNAIPAHHKNAILRTKIKTFLKRARAAYGRTALCLSGGAMMGNYHFGAVKALLETGLLPHIISGTSAGSVIGAMICTRTDEELLRELKPENLYSKMVIV
jgi:predicted acylesterase/phospholipase RssA